MHPSNKQLISTIHVFSSLHDQQELARALQPDKTAVIGHGYSLCNPDNR